MTTASQAARPATEDLRQGEGRTVLAVLGAGPSTCANWRRSASRTRQRRRTTGARVSTGSRSTPSKPVASRRFFSSSGTHWSPARTRPVQCRRQAIPKENGRKVRILSIPAIRDRVVQGTLKCLLEPIFEADFQPGSFGSRPKRSAHHAVDRVAEAIVQGKTRVVDLDLRSYFDSVRHDLLLAKVARWVKDRDVLALLKRMLKASGKTGVPQSGVISPVLSNLYLTEVDRMLERAKAVTRSGQYTRMEYARFADDVVILVDAYPRQGGLLAAVTKKLRGELALLRVAINEEKSRIVDLAKGESFGFLGVCLPACPLQARRLVAAADAATEEADRVAAAAQGGLPTLPIPARSAGDRTDQSGAARLGPVLCRRARESVLLLRPRLGGEEGAAAPDAGTEAAGLPVEEVE